MTSPALIAVDPAMKKVVEEAEHIAPFSTTVLIEGETGTGKEMVARHIHEHSDHSTGPFVVLDCSVIPEPLLESTLFGHERGAFTGAGQARDGIIETAQGGTLLLDEVSSLGPKAQSVLLRFIETHEIPRVGSGNPKSIDVRIIAVTNHQLQSLIDDGCFRADLFHRLTALRIWIPPLRHRRSDIAPLMDYYLTYWSNYHGIRRVLVPSEVTSKLLHYQWPGNVRELRNASEYFVVQVPNGYIEQEDFLHFQIGDQIQHVISRAEQTRGKLADPSFLMLFLNAWITNEGNVRKIAQSLDISVGAVSNYTRILELS